MGDGPRQLPVVLRSGEDGWIVAVCPIIPGCITQGRTREEALRNIREAVELCLEAQPDEGWTLPEAFEVVHLDVSF
ncbi:MAG TPA: type II toxin-antitoxin system HicB family antitoxin [Myxococcota bacterium]|nr:type II toxin-antitoxin system HicB family antitoxin [Myxococcota bacterium]